MQAKIIGCPCMLSVSFACQLLRKKVKRTAFIERIFFGTLRITFRRTSRLHPEPCSSGSRLNRKKRVKNLRIIRTSRLGKIRITCITILLNISGKLDYPNSDKPGPTCTVAEREKIRSRIVMTWVTNQNQRCISLYKLGPAIWWEISVDQWMNDRDWCSSLKNPRYVVAFWEMLQKF